MQHDWVDGYGYVPCCRRFHNHGYVLTALWFALHHGISMLQCTNTNPEINYFQNQDGA
jgi:hypothetical protein